MSFLKTLKEWFGELRGKGPAAAVALTLDLGVARDNKPFNVECGGLFVEYCTGDLYARVNGPNGDGMNLKYIKKILYPFSGLYLTNTAQAGASARLLLLPTGMDADPPAAAGGAGALDYQSVAGTTDASTSSQTYVDVPEMSLTVPSGKGGTYLVLFTMFNVRLTYTGLMSSAFMRLLRNAAVLAEAECAYYYSLFSHNYWTIHVFASLAAGDVVKAQWRCADPDSTLFNDVVSETALRRLSLLKIA